MGPPGYGSHHLWTFVSRLSQLTQNSFSVLNGPEQIKSIITFPLPDVEKLHIVNFDKFNLTLAY